MGRQTGFLGVKQDLHSTKSGDIRYQANIHTRELDHKAVKRFLGYFNTAEAAARYYDCIALAWRGPSARVNFSPANYSAEDIESAVQALPDRRRSMIKTSVYKGVAAKEGRFQVLTWWQYKRIYVGLYKSEEYAAQQYDLAQTQLYGGNVTAVPPYKLNFDWSEHTPEAIRQLLSRVAAKVAAGLLSDSVSPQQPTGVQSNKAQPLASQAVAEPESGLQYCHSPQLLKRRQASSESDSDDRAAAGAPQAKRQRVGGKSCPPGLLPAQAACNDSLLSDMPGQQSMQQHLTNPHQALQATAAVLPAKSCQQAAAASSLSTAVPLVHTVEHVNERAADAVLQPFKVGKAHSQRLNQAQTPGGTAAEAKPVAQPESIKQQQLQQLLTDELHAAAVLVYCADDAYSTAKAAGLPRRQLKSCRRDVQVAVQELATAIAQTVVSLVPPRSSSCEQGGCCKGQPMQQAQERPGARSSSRSQQQHQSRQWALPTAASLHHSSRPRCSQDQPETSKRQRLKKLVDLFTTGRVAK